MNCKDVLGRLDPFLDGELEMEANLEVARHLEDCAGCASVFEGERKLIEELRRPEPAAPAPLRARIAQALDRAEAPAPRRAAFRVLIPAMAAAALLALFASVFPSGEAAAQGIARQAARWHDGPKAAAVAVSGAPELVSYFRGRGQDCCLHEELVSAGLKYGYKNGFVEKSGISGAVTCWWTARCPVSGKRMTHAVFRAPVPPVPPGRLHRFEAGGRIILLGYRDGFV